MNFENWQGVTVEEESKDLLGKAAGTVRGGKQWSVVGVFHVKEGSRFSRIPLASGRAYTWALLVPWLTSCGNLPRTFSNEMAWSELPWKGLYRLFLYGDLSFSGQEWVLGPTGRPVSALLRRLIPEARNVMVEKQTQSLFRGRTSGMWGWISYGKERSEFKVRIAVVR